MSLEASLRISIPPLTQLIHHPERVEHVTRTVHLHRPGDSDSDSETATAACEDGATASATATAYAYVPSATIAKEVTVTIVHPEHVKAETVERVARHPQPTRSETLSSGVRALGSDDPFAVLVLPEPEPEDPPAEQEPADGLRGWFDRPWDGSGPGETRRDAADSHPAGRGCAGYHRRGPGGGAGDAPPVRPRAHRHVLRRRRTRRLRHRLGGVRPDGRGRRGARRGHGPRPPSSWR